MTILGAAPDPAPEPPRAPRKPASTAFQRNLAEQRAAARNAPDPAPARPASPPRPARQAAPAPASRAAGRETRAPLAPERLAASLVPVWPGVRFDGGAGGGSSGGGGNLGGTGAAAPGGAGDDDLDCESLLGLLPGDGDSGIFELLLPCGARLAVVADIAQRQASFLLTPSTERLRQQLNKRKMELEAGLAQRMDRPVRLTLL